MMRRLAILGAAICALVVPGVASAHPLGNFTVNHYARLEPTSDAIRVTYVLDMAEIPTFQEGPQLEDLEAYAARRADAIADHLRLSLDGQPLRLHTERHAIAMPPGAGGLSTLRLEAVYTAPVTWSGSAARLDFQDTTDPDRIGWREIVARPGAEGVTIDSSSVSATDVSDELRTYPQDLLQSPLNQRDAHLSIALQPLGQASATHTQAADAPAPNRTADAQSGVAALARSGSALVDLASADRLTPGFILVALATAMALGMVHALQPGHGKTVVAAYLVGARGTARHALFLGATVTLTHTAGVYALGLVTLLLSQYVVPERLYPILEVVSGVLVIVMGGWVLGRRLLAVTGRSASHDHDHHDHDHEHEHEHDHAHDHAHGHDHGHGHSHALPERVGWRSLLALGVSGGLLPCPEALLVLLVTIAAHRLLFGLVLIVAFSTGLAGVLVGFGLLLVYARGLFSRVNMSSTALLPRLLPLASAAVIMIAGGVITLQALPRVL